VPLQHGERPPVDGDVLCRGQEVEEEEHAENFCQVRLMELPFNYNTGKCFYYCRIRRIQKSFE
jgi:hypothetical protein